MQGKIELSKVRILGLGEELEVGGGDFDGGGQEAGELDEETALFAAADA